MTYKITVEKIETVTEQSRDWKILSDSGEYGYAPPIDVQRSKTTKVFEQIVDTTEVDLKSIIKAVNNLR